MDQLTPTPKISTKIIWLLFLIFAAAVVSTLFASTIFFKSKINETEKKNNGIVDINRTLNEKISKLESELNQLKNQPQNITGEKYTFPIQDKIFAPNSDSLYYVLNNTKREVDVYLEINNHIDTVKIVSDVPIGGASGSMPEFLPTSNPNIVLLTTGDADSGWRYKNYCYIDIEKMSVITVNSNNQAYFELIDSQKVKTTVGINIENKCSSVVKDHIQCKNSGTASLDDLTVNDKKIGILQVAKILSCFDPEGLGKCYKEDVQLEYGGISKDMGKVYFSFTGKRWNEGKATTLWQESYSLNVKSKVITKEEPNNLLD